MMEEHRYKLHGYAEHLVRGRAIMIYGEHEVPPGSDYRLIKVCWKDAVWTERVEPDVAEPTEGTHTANKL